MKKSVLGFSAKFALLIMLVCSAMLSSCYDKNATTPAPGPGPVEPATYFISGTVSDAVTGDVIPNLSVVITPTQKGDITISNGTYKAELPAAGEYKLEFSAEGYTTITSTVSVKEVTSGPSNTYYNAVLKKVDSHDSHGDDSHGGGSGGGSGSNE